MTGAERLRAIEALISRHRSGYALEREFHVRPEVFNHDVELLLDRWLWAGHASEATGSGDWFTVELGAESAIVVRGDDGQLRAFANVCRHRGSRIVDGARGSSSLLVCPYHAWTYRLDGRLRSAREMPAEFDAAAHGLKSLPIAVAGGLVFVSFGERPPAIEPAMSAIEAMTRGYGWSTAKIAARRTYFVAANWKLVMENYHECYHCAPAHPEFSVLHTLARVDDRRIEATVDAATGIADFEAWSPLPDGREVGRVMRSRLTKGRVTGSEDGAFLAPPMTDPALAGTCVFAEFGFLSAFLAYGDHGVVYRFIPREVQRTEMEVVWLVRGDALEGRDYDVGRLTWLWDITSLADKAIIERNQAGVRSRAYAPGPFSLMEPGTSAYVERYLGELAARVGVR